VLADHLGRPVGRPRSAEADAAIVDAVLALLAESGFEGVTVEAVAQRAGVARSTVYRRFPDRAHLVESVLHQACQIPVVDPDTGSVGGDLVAIATGLRRVLTTTEFGRALPAVVAAAAGHAEVAEAHRAFVATRRRVSLDAVRRGVERGEVDPDLDPEVLIDMVVGPVFHRLFMSRRAVPDEWIAELVERSVRACAPHSPDR
jgi:AcrR family transcriptional regulator